MVNYRRVGSAAATTNPTCVAPAACAHFSLNNKSLSQHLDILFDNSNTSS